MKHWTAGNPETFSFSVVTDFIDEITARMKQRNITQAQISEKMGVTKQRLSKILTDPGNLTLKTMVRLAQAVGSKMAVVVYDGDEKDQHAPIVSRAFVRCWESRGKPRTEWDLSESCGSPAAPTEQR